MADAPPAPPAAAEGLVLARILRLDDAGRPWLEPAGGGPERPARALAGLAPEALAAAAASGAPAVAAVLGGELLLLGFLSERPAPPSAPPAVLRLEAAERVELRCGQASIELGASGKVLIRGGYLLSRSTGANVIKGRPTAIN